MCYDARNLKITHSEEETPMQAAGKNFMMMMFLHMSMDMCFSCCFRLSD